VLVHLSSGIGNIVLATPLLRVLRQHGFVVDVRVDGDYPATADLLRGWDILRDVFGGPPSEPPDHPARHYRHVVPAIPPFYWDRYAALYRHRRDCVGRPPPRLFYLDEQAYYLAFAKSLGCDLRQPPTYRLPAIPDRRHGVTRRTLVLAPGCKTGEMAAKRWPHFAALAECFADIAVVGTADDLSRFDGAPLRFPAHVRSLVDRLSLPETAAVLASAGAVVANDSGLGHVAGAVGAPTLLLFGPTPDRTLGRFPPGVRVMRGGLACEPCWFTRRFAACQGRIDCLDRLGVEPVRRAAEAMLGAHG
jgi:ADP-heptose:LPS heptosyltransferase